ncbi:MAG: hypothetical protein WDW38_006492 [Sanguina aurantia]
MKPTRARRSADHRLACAASARALVIAPRRGAVTNEDARWQQAMLAARATLPPLPDQQRSAALSCKPRSTASRAVSRRTTVDRGATRAIRLRGRRRIAGRCAPGIAFRIACVDAPRCVRMPPLPEPLPARSRSRHPRRSPQCRRPMCAHQRPSAASAAIAVAACAGRSTRLRGPPTIEPGRAPLRTRASSHPRGHRDEQHGAARARPATEKRPTLDVGIAARDRSSAGRRPATRRAACQTRAVAGKMRSKHRGVLRREARRWQELHVRVIDGAGAMCEPKMRTAPRDASHRAISSGAPDPPTEQRARCRARDRLIASAATPIDARGSVRPTRDERRRASQPARFARRALRARRVHQPPTAARSARAAPAAGAGIADAERRHRAARADVAAAAAPNSDDRPRVPQRGDVRSRCARPRARSSGARERRHGDERAIETPREQIDAAAAARLTLRAARSRRRAACAEAAVIQRLHALGGEPVPAAVGVGNLQHQRCDQGVRVAPYVGKHAAENAPSRAAHRRAPVDAITRAARAAARDHAVPPAPSPRGNARRGARAIDRRAAKRARSRARAIRRRSARARRASRHRPRGGRASARLGGARRVASGGRARRAAWRAVARRATTTGGATCGAIASDASARDGRRRGGAHAPRAGTRASIVEQARR